MTFILFPIQHLYIFPEINLDNPREIFKGLHQGGVLSALLYIIAVMNLTNNLRKNVKESEFADDFVIYVES